MTENDPQSNLNPESSRGSNYSKSCQFNISAEYEVPMQHCSYELQNC